LPFVVYKAQFPKFNLPPVTSAEKQFFFVPQANLLAGLNHGR